MSENTRTLWNLDQAHSEISFKVKHMMITTVTGHFDEYSARAEATNEGFIDADFTFVAKTASVNTRNKDRDEHLKSPDFFHAEHYPEIRFTSTSFDGETMLGVLTIKGITREIAIDMDFNGIAIDPYGQTKAGFEGNVTVNRKDFNLTWSALTEQGNIVVSDSVRIGIVLQFVKSS
ncbi:YceI family protein [Flavobacterium beibuense]|nr:YceI family protein [Flavobacterium beibuense]